MRRPLEINLREILPKKIMYLCDSKGNPCSLQINVSIDLATGNYSVFDGNSSNLKIDGLLSDLEIRAFASGADVVELRDNVSYKKTRDFAFIYENKIPKRNLQYDLEER